MFIIYGPCGLCGEQVDNGAAHYVDDFPESGDEDYPYPRVALHHRCAIDWLIRNNVAPLALGRDFPSTDQAAV